MTKIIDRIIDPCFSFTATVLHCRILRADGTGEFLKDTKYIVFGVSTQGKQPVSRDLLRRLKYPGHLYGMFHIIIRPATIKACPASYSCLGGLDIFNSPQDDKDQLSC